MTRTPGGSSNSKSAEITLGSVYLAANQPITWSIQSGIAPYTTVFSCHKSEWTQIESQLGQPKTLTIKQGSKTTEIKNVYPLYQVSSDSPERVSFVVADVRWRFKYVLHVRDYNMRRKTGELVTSGGIAQNVVTSPKFRYLAYSINPETDEPYTAEEIISDVLTRICLDEDYDFLVESVSYGGATPGGANTEQAFTAENLQIRDPGDAALGRALALMPGTDIYVNTEGKIVVFNASDYELTDEVVESLPDGDTAANFIQKGTKRAIRPRFIDVFYQREIEMLIEYEEAWVGTSAQPQDDDPVCENVCRTVDPKTKITDRNPETGALETTNDVPPGVVVPIRNWLESMDEDKPENSQPWTFETFSQQWLVGDLEAYWAVGGERDIDVTANVRARFENFVSNFRQMWRLNPAYAARIRTLLPYRVGVFNFVAGRSARSPACVWSQHFVTSTHKGSQHFVNVANGIDGLSLGRNVDYVPSNIDVIATKPPSPMQMIVVDEENGIFRTQYRTDPYGLEATHYPGFGTKNGSYAPEAMTRNMVFTDDASGPSLFVNAVVQSAPTGRVLSPRFKQHVLATVVPAFPNGRSQCHKITIDCTTDVELNAEIGECRGPRMAVFVSPQELTARYGLQSRNQARTTLKTLLGLNESDPDGTSIQPGDELPGYALLNEENHLTEHAKSVAAQILSPMLDVYDGVHSAPLTAYDAEDLDLQGNVTSREIVIAPYPSGNVDTRTRFAPASRPINREALLPMGVRHIVLKTL